MNRHKRALSWWMLGLLLGAVVWSFASAQGGRDEPLPVTVTAETHPSSLSPGQEGWVAVTIVLAPNWHIYGNPKGPGPGLATSLEVVSLPEGVRASPARFLPAEKLREAEFGPDEWVWAYRNRTTIYLPLSTPRNLTPGRHPVHLRLKLLLCTEGLCLPHQTEITASLTVSPLRSGAGVLSPTVAEALRRTHPGEEKGSGSTGTVESPKGADSGQPGLGKLAELPNLFPRPIHRAMEVDSLVKAVIFAFVAGLVLNVMPCVLPVVSLKILSFVQDSQGSRRRAAFMGLSFAAGIVTVFLILAALASFAGYGWGELFQKQAFILAMIVVLFAMAMSLFDLFHLPIPQVALKADAAAAGHGHVGCFSRGMLATFLATPCSGPLLGGAMAWTLRQSPPLIFVIFAVMGLGMAAPYIILAISPATLRWLPRPGPWLVHFERFMGFALLATVVYLLTILPGEMRVWVVLFCLFLGLGLYIWGQITTLSDSTRRRVMVRLVALLVICAGSWLSLYMLPAMMELQSPGPRDDLSWEPYTQEKLLAAAAARRWVVVDFTADWCPNCVLVERATLQDRRVRQAFRDRNALLLKADLTRDNPPAKLLLERMGSRSIPFLAIFPPGEQFWHPFFLRDIYRVDDVVSVLGHEGGG
jgi:thiol:disulfide interchange protein